MPVAATARVSRADVAALRRVEQTAAAAVVGVSDLVFLGHPDGRVQADLALRHDISRVIREVRPQVVLCQSPERNYDRIFASHPDHLASGEAACALPTPTRRTRSPFRSCWSRVLEPWKVSEVWLSAHPSATDAMDVTDHFDRKLEALLCHASQHPDPDGLEGRMRMWMCATAAANGLSDGRLAEAFRVVAVG